MKQITLDSLCIENFRSFVGPSVIEFGRANGLKFISGANRIEPALGANGSGKSTVFDAICYALYGESIRGLRASELKSNNTRSTTTLVILQIDDEPVAIQRTSPPERLTVNDRPATQKEIDQLVGLSRDRFLASVIFGQAVPLFIDLAKPQRGDLLDEVLNLEVWIRAASKATEWHNRQSTELTDLRIKTARLEERLAAQPDIGELKALEGAWQNDQDEQLRELIERYKAIEVELQQLAQQITPVDRQSVTEAKFTMDTASATLRQLRERHVALRVGYNRLTADITFFNEHDSCPTCGQDITQEFCNEHLAALTADKEHHDAQLATLATQIRDGTVAVDDLENTWQRAMQNIAGAERAQAVVAEQLRNKREQAIDLQQQTARTRNQKNPYTEQRQQVIVERRRLGRELARQRDTEEKATARLNTVNFWRQGFRRVREYCLDNVLRELTIETRNSLLALGLNGWNIAFSTTTPTQRGTVRFGVEIQIEPPQKPSGSFDILSGGEGQRVRLAVSLGLASLIQRWSGTQWSFEVFDEPTAFLSQEGIDDLLDCLAYRAEAYHKTIWLCDHRSLDYGFAERYLVSKDVNGSRWERI